MRRLVTVLTLVAAAVAAGFARSAGAAGGDASCPAPDVNSLAIVDCVQLPAVESLDPAYSRNFRLPSRPPPAAVQPGVTAACQPLEVVFYAATDWTRLGQKLAADPSPCEPTTQHYISIPPLAADKTQLRSNQAPKIRALGPNFHAMAEINWTGWARWVAATGSTWSAAGAEARRRMAAAGFDVTQGDIWALNEFPSSVRTNTGPARRNARAFVHALYSGDGTVPSVRGLVWIIGMAQTTLNTSVYKTNLENWLGDAAFWGSMRSYVRFWSQEVYPDSRNWGVAGAPADTRRDYLNDFVQHEVTLASAGPTTIASAQTFLQKAYSPLANAAWQWSGGFGYTLISPLQMESFVSSQAYAMRFFSGGSGLVAGDRMGFAWAPRNATALSPADFAAATGEILDRLADAIHESANLAASEPGLGACGAAGEWCDPAITVDGAWFNEAWKTFVYW